MPSSASKAQPCRTASNRMAEVLATSVGPMRKGVWSAWRIGSTRSASRATAWPMARRTRWLKVSVSASAGADCAARRYRDRRGVRRGQPLVRRPGQGPGRVDGRAQDVLAGDARRLAAGLEPVGAVAVAIGHLAALQADDRVVDALDQPLDLGGRRGDLHRAGDRPLRVMEDAIEAALVDGEARVAQQVDDGIAGGRGHGDGPAACECENRVAAVCCMSCASPCAQAGGPARDGGEDGAVPGAGQARPLRVAVCWRRGLLAGACRRVLGLDADQAERAGGDSRNSRSARPPADRPPGQPRPASVIRRAFSTSRASTCACSSASGMATSTVRTAPMSMYTTRPGSRVGIACLTEQPAVDPELGDVVLLGQVEGGHLLAEAVDGLVVRV